jgi:hypothetical protein
MVPVGRRNKATSQPGEPRSSRGVIVRERQAAGHDERNRWRCPFLSADLRRNRRTLAGHRRALLDCAFIEAVCDRSSTNAAAPDCHFGIKVVATPVASLRIANGSFSSEKSSRIRLKR